MSSSFASLRALAHPVRLRILSLVTGTALSAAEIAREVGITQASASYHVRMLAAAGYMQKVDETKIRGGVAKRYSYMPNQSVDIPDADRESWALVFRAMSEELARRALLYQSAGSQYMSDAELWVDEEDWEQATMLAQKASEYLHERAHPPRAPGKIHVTSMMAMFRVGDPNGAQDLP